METEGWYRDPYGLHDARWISNGEPTSLVRDSGVESRDEPPPLPITHPLVEAPSGEQHVDDVHRADEGARGEEPFSAAKIANAGDATADAFGFVPSPYWR